jgi:hypothetical protein
MVLTVDLSLSRPLFMSVGSMSRVRPLWGKKGAGWQGMMYEHGQTMVAMVMKCG